MHVHEGAGHMPYADRLQCPARSESRHRPIGMVIPRPEGRPVCLPAGPPWCPSPCVQRRRLALNGGGGRPCVPSCGRCGERSCGLRTSLPPPRSCSR